MINVLEDAGSHKPSPTCLALRMLKHIQVAPHVGAWIETTRTQRGCTYRTHSRPPRGGVD